MRSPITTHVLDLKEGKPAINVPVSLYFKDNDWKLLSEKRTNKDGRVEDLLDAEFNLIKGIYKIEFKTGEYFSSQKIKCFFPLVSIIFEISDDDKHFHVPLLLSPFGYSTYRGS